MRIFVATLTVLLMLSFPANANGNFRLSASLEKSEVKSGEPISLELVLKNISKRRVHVIRTNYLSAYKIEVKDGGGNRVMPTELGKELLVQSMFVSGRIPIYLDPGQELREKIDIGRIYDFGRPGTYTISAKRNVPKRNNNGSTEVVSNTVKVVVQ
jgi:uncharacterized protein (DUF58 family)